MTPIGRLAHKPYCEATRARLLRVSSVVLCRGCTMTALGLAVGVAAAVWAWFGPLVALPLLLIGLAGLHPPLYAALPNPVRDMTRVALGAAPLPFVAGAWRAGHWYPAAVVLWFCGAWVLHAMRARRSRPQHRCEACALHGS